MIQQVEIILRERPRGFHLVTREISEQLPSLPQTGLLNLFVKHTSCSLSINENADPDVRTDMTKIYDRLIKENEPYYDHVLEGADDMPQGIYLCEFRYYGGRRKLTATIIGE